jgi:hypothetical protein
MKTDDNRSRSIGDNEAFVLLIKTATEDEEIRKVIETILGMPTHQRKVLIFQIIEDMKRDSVRADLIEAIAALTDEDIAHRVRGILNI